MGDVTDGAAPERRRRQIDLALGYRIFAALGWGDDGNGHITARDPVRTECFWLLRYGVSFDRATVGDLVLVEPEWEADDGSSGNGNAAYPINPAAFYIHHPIHCSRPDLNAAAHVHTPWGTPFSAEVRPIQPISQEAVFFFDDHAIFDDEEIQVQSLDAGKRIAGALGDNRAVILRNHGLLTTGATVGEAVAGFVTMERAAETHLKARAARAISPEWARFAQADLVKPGMLDSMFDWLIKRHVPNRSVVE